MPKSKKLRAPVQQQDIIPPGKSKPRPTVASRRTLLMGSAVNTIEPASLAVRAVIYCRVSTGESVASNLSIPDQERHLVSFINDKGWSLQKVYREEGRSAKTANRPVFKEMLDDLLYGRPKVQKLVVYHTARFSRRSSDFERYETLLYENGIDVIFVTQNFSKDIGGFIGKAASTLFDEVHSRKTAEDTSRTMTLLALEGWHVGGILPLGYKAVPHETKANRKVIIVNEDERSLARRCFDLALYGEPDCPPLGVKAMAVKLNKEGFGAGRVKRWTKTYIHRILTNPIYKGTKLYNENARDDQWLSRPSGVIVIPVPAIVTPEEFDALTDQLQSKDPRQGTAKRLASPMLLAGIAFCACGAGMTLSTGRNRLGNDYRYYYCHGADTSGKIDCGGPRIPEATLDRMVIEAIINEVVDPKRIRLLLQKLWEQFVAEQGERQGHGQALRERLREAENTFENIYTIAKHSPNLAAEPLILERLEKAQINLNQLRTALRELVTGDEVSSAVTDEQIDYFSSKVIDHLRNGEPLSVKRYLGAVVERVIVFGTRKDADAAIAIVGKRADLQQAIKRECDDSEHFSQRPRVRGFVSKWCRSQDSNLRPHHYQ
ncbi:recombinase family protein [Rhizobium ruizarguesonis]